MIDTNRKLSAPHQLDKVDAKLRYWEEQLHDLSGRNRLLYYRETRASSALIISPAFRDLFVTIVEKGRDVTVPLATAREMRALETEQQSAVTTKSELADKTGSTLEESEDPAGDLLLDGKLLSDEVPDLAAVPADPEFQDAMQEDQDEGAKTLGAPQSAPRADAPEAEDAPAGRRKLRKRDILTNHSVAQLNRVMYNLHYTARTVQEEQGIHILYLTFGMLKWKENHSLNFSRAPLILVPVHVQRDNPNSPYKIRMAEEDILANPVLQIKLSKDFGIQLPEVNNDIDLGALEAFLADTAETVSRYDGWEVHEDVTIGAFNFLTLLLVKDIDNHAALYRQHPFVQLLSGVRGVQIPEPEHIPQAEELDDTVDPSQVFQVLDADSSQQEAIEAAKRGLSFVLQGPPGTGKSQTIANIIVESIMAGKRVLFVSQKSAALEVVQKRLARKGLNEFCLEIHSHQLDKRRILQDLMRSLAEAPLPIPNPDYRLQQEELKKIKEELNTYVHQLHEPRFELGLSLFQAQGNLARVISAPQLNFSVPDPQSVSSTDYSRMLALVREAAGYPEIIESYNISRWKGFNGLEISLEAREHLSEVFEAALAALEDLHERMGVVISACGLPRPETIEDDLGYLDTLRLYTPAIFSPVLGPVIERYLAEMHRTGRFFDAQYRQDAAALRDIGRPNVRAEQGEAARALDFAAKVIRARRTIPDEDINYLPLPDLSALEQNKRRIGQGFEAALAIFDPSELPAPLARGYDQTPGEAADWFAEHAAWTSELGDWVNFNLIREECRKMGLGDFVVKALAARLPADMWEAAFSRRFQSVLIEKLTAGRPVLQRFKGATQSELVRRFRALDLAMIESSAREIRAELGKKKPQWSWLQAGSAETSILRREANKKRRIMPLRRLFAEIPSLIQALKPCLMMSPLTVCQLLDPSIYEFDLVVFDEASQIPPEYAISAFVRARQVIVAGDSQQLPPTNFFHNLEAEDTEYEAEGSEPIFESILSACDSCGFPNKMLNWHYRSKDESLIAYSNYHFYDNRLYTFPNASLNSPTTGLKFVYVDNAIYKGGEGARYNVAEARRVAELVYDHLATVPQLSLGIVTLSVPQRRAVEAEIERLRVQHPELNALFTYEAAEPIFVKNLENVQGDERDVIILCIGYGRDAAGKLALNFGPINQDGGARRLNVAVTRARYLLKLVASIQPEDIDLRRASSRGAYLLRNYMEAARDGVGAVFHERNAGPAPESDSALENLVYDELTGRGFKLERRVGVSQYRIDLAVVDPEQAGHYLLGIECDGPMYRSASTARDRDRLRQQVLESLGWRIHRIWSRDWIQNPQAEIERILRRLNHPTEPVADPQPPAALERIAIRPRMEHDEDESAAPQAVDSASPLSAFSYRTPSLKPRNPSGREAFMGAALSDVIDDLQAVANAEGPLSVRSAKALVLQAWKTRSSAEVDQRLESAVQHGARQKAFRLNGTFLWPMGMQVAPLRIHSSDGATRPMDEIAPEEIEVALRECVKAALTIRRDDLLRETCKLFGLRATAANLEPVRAVLERLVGQQVLSLQDEKVSRGARF